jgi:hypothetical protein
MAAPIAAQQSPHADVRGDPAFSFVVDGPDVFFVEHCLPAPWCT